VGIGEGCFRTVKTKTFAISCDRIHSFFTHWPGFIVSSSLPHDRFMGFDELGHMLFATGTQSFARKPSMLSSERR
jgi:hypothetical protein